MALNCIFFSNKPTKMFQASLIVVYRRRIISDSSKTRVKTSKRTAPAKIKPQIPTTTQQEPQSPTPPFSKIGL